MDTTELAKRVLRRQTKQTGRTSTDQAKWKRELAAAGDPSPGGKPTTLRYPSGSKLACLVWPGGPG